MAKSVRQPTGGLIDYIQTTATGAGSTLTLEKFEQTIARMQDRTWYRPIYPRTSTWNPSDPNDPYWPEACALVSPKPVTRDGLVAFWEAHPELRGTV